MNNLIKSMIGAARLDAQTFLPTVGWAIFFGVTIWMLFAFVVAVRQALDYTGSPRALLVCLLGWLIHGVLFFAFVVTAI